MEEKYQKYLEMSYEDFFNATHMYSRYDTGDYIYAISKKMTIRRIGYLILII